MPAQVAYTLADCTKAHIYCMKYKARNITRIINDEDDHDVFQGFTTEDITVMTIINILLLQLF